MKRDQVKLLSNTMTLTDALVAAHLHYHTRYPIADGGDVDRIMGYVNFKDIVIALHINPKDPIAQGHHAANAVCQCCRHRAGGA